MTDLSPAASAVWEAFNQDEAGVFVDYGDKLAAALRAVVAHTQDQNGYNIWICDADELLAIAAELEGTQ